MISVADYQRYDGLGLAALVRAGEVTPTELLEAAIACAERINPQINAIVIPMHEIARERARGHLVGPFAGVPFLIKDVVQDYAGVPTTAGSRAIDYVPPTHAEITERFLRSGVVIFGKTNTPELALKGITEPARWGPTRNPWDLERTPGGSSGGAAAAVAAGIVPMAGANDGGGSIRIPAACCGLFGLRPSRGRVPLGPRIGEVWEGASSDLVVSRSVRDSAAMLDAVHGADVGAPFEIRPPQRPYLDELQQPPGRLRIAFSTRSPIGTEVHAECVRAVIDAARLLEDLGHHVEEAEPEIDGERLAQDFLTMYMGQVAADIAHWAAVAGARETDFEPDTRALGLLGRTLPAHEYILARRRWNDYARALGRFHERYSLYMTPTLAQPPVRIGELAPPRWLRIAQSLVLAAGAGRFLHRSGVVEQLARENLAKVPFTQLANLTGTPAMSVPLHWTADGLPVGVQFIARFGGEDVLLRLAAQLEQARPWAQRRPAL
ncbi:amidase [Fontimonas thermophila]|uniref:Amidase n=1 Tax=Fontimonas thermophila TaxID=1076937 RepID=A0A1I2J1W1_9GAMM|nr:amidase [Fontimonas thermophila]SFF47998.1 amidase [Fontimonas thermophila]